MSDVSERLFEYIDYSLERLSTGRVGELSLGWPDDPSMVRILNKLEMLMNNLRQIHDIRLELGGVESEQSLAAGIEQGVSPLQYLLSLVEKRVSELEDVIVLDELTGMLNRQMGLRAIEQRLKDSFLREESFLAFIDLDSLKKINDSYGHKEGDLFIKSVATLILSSIRRADIAVRYGGDEFLILFVGCGRKAATKKMREISGELSRLNNSSFRPYHMSFSYGLASVAPPMQGLPFNLWDMISAADKKMYANKRRRAKAQPRESSNRKYVGRH